MSYDWKSPKGKVLIAKGKKRPIDICIMAVGVGPFPLKFAYLKRQAFRFHFTKRPFEFHTHKGFSYIVPTVENDGKCKLKANFKSP